MTKQELIRDMERKFPGCGLLSTVQVAQYRGVSRWRAQAFLQGMEHAGYERKRLYFVGDVADKILEERRRA